MHINQKFEMSKETESFQSPHKWEEAFLKAASDQQIDYSELKDSEKSWEKQFLELSNLYGESAPTTIEHVQEVETLTKSLDIQEQKKEKAAQEITKTVHQKLGKEIPRPKTLPYPLSKISFSLENLWANISVEIESPPLMMVFTGSRKGEGVTFVSYNFALYISLEHSLKTLYVDCDTDSQTHPFLRNKLSSFPGLIDFFLDNVSLPDLCISTEYPNFYVLPYGKNKKGVKLTKLLFLRERLNDLVRSLRHDFDVIVIDTPSVLSHPEISILGRKADEVILVCRYRVSQYEVSQLAVERLTNDGITKIRAVLNDRFFPIPDFIYKKLK